MATFSRCKQEASDIVAVRLTDTHFSARLERSSTTWKMEFPVFIQRVEGVVAIALFSAYRSTEKSTNTEAPTAALNCLRELSPLELFAVLPAELGESSTLVEHLRLLSTGLTSRSGILWERLAQTARNVLDADAEFPDEEHVVDRSDGPTHTGITLSVPRLPPEK